MFHQGTSFTTGEIEGVAPANFGITMLELNDPEQRGLTYRGVVLELGGDVVGQSVVIRRDTYVLDSGKLMYMDEVTVGENAPRIADVCHQPEWVEILKTMVRCKEDYDFPWIRSDWNSH